MRILIFSLKQRQNPYHCETGQTIILSPVLEIRKRVKELERCALELGTDPGVIPGPLSVRTPQAWREL